MTSVSRYERLRSLGKKVETPENNFVLFSWVLAIIPSFRKKSNVVGDQTLACQRGGGDCGGYTSLNKNDTFTQI